MSKQEGKWRERVGGKGGRGGSKWEMGGVIGSECVYKIERMVGGTGETHTGWVVVERPCMEVGGIGLGSKVGGVGG